MTEGRRREAVLRRVFRLSLFLKAAHSVVELIGGVMLYAASGDAILRVTRALTRHELLEHPDDLVARALLRAGEILALEQKAAATVYLLSHGLVEIFLVVMILLNRIWAYPLYMIALGVLILYQCYQLTLDFWPLLALLTLWDVAVVCLTWHEFRVRRALGRPNQEPAD